MVFTFRERVFDFDLFGFVVSFSLFKVIFLKLDIRQCGYVFLMHRFSNIPCIVSLSMITIVNSVFSTLFEEYAYCSLFSGLFEFFQQRCFI